jgi:tetratricopeptide (TPR) repeat protein
MPWRRRSYWILLAVTTTIVTALTWILAVRAYQNWQIERDVRAAQGYLAKQDNRNAILSLKAALLRHPNHLEARRALAALLEEAYSPEALPHRRKLVDMQPQALEPKLALAQTALRLGETREASKALRSIKGSDRKTPGFMELQAQLYVRRGRPEMALEVYRELVELYPEDRGARVRLTALELQSGPDFDRPIARETLVSMASNEEFTLLALRALATDALQSNDFSAALVWSKRASELPLSEFSDRMLYLRALFSAKSPSFENCLAELDQAASENLQFVLELAKWKADALGPEATSVWLKSLPESIRENTAICLILADCYSTLKQWSNLESLVTTSWREQEPLRFALLSRAEAGQGQMRKSERTWQLALAEAERRPEQLASLLAVARTDKRDVRQVLWMIAERDPQNVPARQELYQTYWQERDAEGMLRMMELILKEKPNDRAAKYSVASLLLATGRQIERGNRLAEELYEADPLNLGNAILYGFGLHLQGKSKMAADLLAARDDLHRLGNDGAAYYALVLSGCGRDDQARETLSRVESDILLPELRASLDRAFGTVPKNAVTHSPE